MPPATRTAEQGDDLDIEYPVAESPDAPPSELDETAAAATTTRTKRAIPKPDSVLMGPAAQQLAREAAESIAQPRTVGEHLGAVMLGERLAEHSFASTSTGYVGWQWTVSVARVPRQKFATVCETNLLPGPQAALSPQWLPYAQRLAPGDLGAGDTMPYAEADPYLEAGFEATGDEDVDQVGFFELGLGRPRVLSAEGREAAAQRWFDGAHGPHAEVAQKAAAHCATCGYFVPMPGALRQVFGVCANEWSPGDGSVVSLEHGCGAHSETDVEPRTRERVDAPVLDDFALDTSR